MSEDFKIPTMEEVMEGMNSLFGIIDLLDENYKMYDHNYLMRHMKNRGLSLKEVFLSDMLDWLCFLGWGDGNIDISEVNFINQLLHLNFTQIDVFEVVKNLDAERLTTLPITFAIFIEYEAVSGNDMEVSIVETLYSLFFITGSYLIVADGNVDDNEVLGLKAYMDSLRVNIDTFNLESIHDYMLDQI